MGMTDEVDPHARWIVLHFGTMTLRRGLFALVALALLSPTGSVRAADDAADKKGTESRVFVRTVPDEKTWNTYSRTIQSDAFGKYVLDLKTNEVYYFDVNLYRMHTDFVFEVIYKQPITNEGLRDFIKNYDADKPRFILGYLTHHLKVDEWTFSFWEGDMIKPDDIRRARNVLLKTFWNAKKLKWRPDSPLQEKLLGQLKDIPTITNDKIYKASTYEAFNVGKTTGVLRIIPPGTKYDGLVFDRDQIPILQESYPDITYVSGIITTVFSTPLSHVNLRAKAWNIPNAGIKDAGTKYKKLDGKTVVLEVKDLDYSLREATADEVKAWKEAKVAARTVVVPAGDVTTSELRGLEKIRSTDAKTYGAKTANLGEIVSRAPEGVNVPKGFGIPIYYYVQHMKENKLDKEVDALLADKKFQSDAAYRKEALEKLKADIKKAPINKKFFNALYAKWQKDLGGKGVFVRSSTTAEDLEGFNGAGLYDTVPNVKTKAQLEDAVKVVWASLWNFAAYEERSLYGIDQTKVYAGVMMLVGINGTAAGVLVTKNLFDPEDTNSYTINAKKGLGLRVVGGTTIPEQIVFDTSNYGTKIISRSDDPTMLVFDEKNGNVKEVPVDSNGVILTEARAYALSKMVEKIVPLFSAKYPLDVEWVMEGEKVWIVQARPFMSK
jgi:hypothetical protein